MGAKNPHVAVLDRPHGVLSSRLRVKKAVRLDGRVYRAGALIAWRWMDLPYPLMVSLLKKGTLELVKEEGSQRKPKKKRKAAKKAKTEKKPRTQKKAAKKTKAEKPPEGDEPPKDEQPKSDEPPKVQEPEGDKPPAELKPDAEPPKGDEPAEE